MRPARPSRAPRHTFDGQQLGQTPAGVQLLERSPAKTNVRSPAASNSTSHRRDQPHAGGGLSRSAAWTTVSKAELLAWLRDFLGEDIRSIEDLRDGCAFSRAVALAHSQSPGKLSGTSFLFGLLLVAALYYMACAKDDTDVLQSSSL